MPSVDLTDAHIRKTAVKDGERVELWDARTPGLCIRIGAASRTWIYRYRVDGKYRRMKLGTFPALSLKDAREIARDTAHDRRKGADPVAERQTRERALAGKVSFRGLFDAYVEAHLSKLRSGLNSAEMFKRHAVASLGDKPAADISRSDLVALLRSIVADGKGTTANHTFRTARALFNWAVTEEILNASPVVGIKLPFREESRDRVISDNELAVLMKAWTKMSYPWAQWYRLLLLTGQRREEVAGISLNEIVGDVWIIPKERYKGKRVHTVPLTARVAKIIETCPRQCDLIFSTNGRTSISGFSKAKAKCDELAESIAVEDGVDLHPWRVHDIRRTVASGMARLGVVPHVIEAVLGHANGQISGIAAVYNRHSYDAEKRAALDLWGSHVEGLIASQ